MPSTIKMIAVVDGKETTVGRCHPGQARILRKQGLAEWKDGKLLFREARDPDLTPLEVLASKQEPLSVEAIVALAGNPPEPPHSHPRELGWEGFMERLRPLERCPTRRLAVEALTEACEEVDPEHLVSGVCLGTGGSTSRGQALNVSYPDTLDDYLHEMYTRREAGHALWAYEEYATGRVGFTDLEDEVSFEVPMAIVKVAVTSANWKASTWPPGIEDARDHLRTWRGRQEMVGMPVVEFDDGEEGLLEDLWGPLEHDESGPLPFLGDWLPDVGPQE